MFGTIATYLETRLAARHQYRTENDPLCNRCQRMNRREALLAKQSERRADEAQLERAEG